ncbi:hypothetical protein LCGC14_1719110 [marine sediment metagenome]|uniref:Uncharacterized protein n=1 Tax=marine sediment metagenome TaxID=412755 RepID=A0A0F9HD95_9ZZZZ
MGERHWLIMRKLQKMNKIPNWIMEVYRKILVHNYRAEHIRILTNNEGRWVITYPDLPLHIADKTTSSISLQKYIDGLQNDTRLD